jgi:hypothetical protein
VRVWLGLHDPDDDLDPLGLVWSDDGSRSLRWRANCPTHVPRDVHEDGRRLRGPPDAACYQAVALSAAGNEVGFQELIDRYSRSL